MRCNVSLFEAATAGLPSGRPIHLELSYSLDITQAAAWVAYSNGWRTGANIECCCGTPLTDCASGPRTSRLG
jgi:hypothetical protein